MNFSSLQLHTLIDPVPIKELGSWASQLTQFDGVVGYTVLGQVFLRSSEADEYAFIDQATPIRYIEAISEHVERLGEAEVYIPRPYPILGGSMQPDTYGKGDFWVFIDMVGQTHGF